MAKLFLSYISTVVFINISVINHNHPFYEISQVSYSCLEFKFNCSTCDKSTVIIVLSFSKIDYHIFDHNNQVQLFTQRTLVACPHTTV